MRWTKIALLTFGAGLILGLTIVVLEIDWLDRAASALMALGLAAIPIGMIVDWRRAAKSAGAARGPPAKGVKRAAAPSKRKAPPGARKAPPGTRRNARPPKPTAPKR